MPSKIEVIRNMCDYTFSSDIDWEGLPKLVADAATVRGDPHVIREIIEDIVADVRAGKITVEEALVNDAPCPLAIYNLARERQEEHQLEVVRVPTRAKAASMRRVQQAHRLIERRSFARRRRNETIN